MAADTAVPPTCNVSATATKLMAPPICRAARAHATLHPTSGPNAVSGKSGYATNVPHTVAKAPSRKQAKRDPVSVKIRFMSESKSSIGTARGTRNWLVISSNHFHGCFSGNSKSNSNRWM